MLCGVSSRASHALGTITYIRRHGATRHDAILQTPPPLTLTQEQHDKCALPTKVSAPQSVKLRGHTLVAEAADADSDAFTLDDVRKTSGQVLYIENRAPVVRSATQTEDIKIVLTL